MTEWEEKNTKKMYMVINKEKNHLDTTKSKHKWIS